MPSTVSKYIAAIGIEMEGGWARFRSKDSQCDHICGDDCLLLECKHSCQLETCAHHLEGDNSACKNCRRSHKMFWRYLPCWTFDRCGHVHKTWTPRDRGCYISRCQHVHNSQCCGNAQLPFHNDVSVKNLQGCRFSGEMVSPPCYDLGLFEQFINRFHPDKVNGTCGTHFHISTNSSQDYGLLMSADFYKHFRGFLLDWINENNLSKYQPLMDRVNGRNRFCCPNDKERCVHGKAAHIIDAQYRLTHKSPVRFTHINYCWSMHQTLEFRVFHGMKTPARILRAANCIVDSVNTYLDKIHTECGNDPNKISEYLKKKEERGNFAKFVPITDVPYRQRSIPPLQVTPPTMRQPRVSLPHDELEMAAFGSEVQALRERQQRVSRAIRLREWVVPFPPLEPYLSSSAQVELEEFF